MTTPTPVGSGIQLNFLLKMEEFRIISVLWPFLENTNKRHREVTAADEARKLLHPQTTDTMKAELKKATC